jgi:hypothetical protein
MARDRTVLSLYSKAKGFNMLLVVFYVVLIGLAAMPVCDYFDIL